jgi:hypothetical protein
MSRSAEQGWTCGQGRVREASRWIQRMNRKRSEVLRVKVVKKRNEKKKEKEEIGGERDSWRRSNNYNTCRRCAGQVCTCLQSISNIPRPTPDPLPATRARARRSTAGPRSLGAASGSGASEGSRPGGRSSQWEAEGPGGGDQSGLGAGGPVTGVRTIDQHLRRQVVLRSSFGRLLSRQIDRRLGKVGRKPPALYRSKRP